MFRYIVWYRKPYERCPHQKSFRFAADASDWIIGATEEGCEIVSIHKQVPITSEQLVDDAWAEFGERSS